MSLYLAGGHPRVNECSVVPESGSLTFSSTNDSFSNGSRTLDRRLLRQFTVLNPWYRDLDVDAVQQRTGDPGQVPLNLGRRAQTSPLRIARIPARTGVHRRHEDKRRGKRQRHLGSGDRHALIFERLAQHFEDMAGKFRQLIQKQDAVVRQADLAGAGN